MVLDAIPPAVVENAMVAGRREMEVAVWVLDPRPARRVFARRLR